MIPDSVFVFLFFMACSALGGGLLVYAFLTMPPTDPDEAAAARRRHPSHGYKE